MKNNEMNVNVPKELFQFAKTEGTLHDTKLDTKPLNYLQDAWNRFKKNKSSVVAGIIIILLILFAIIGPFVTPYEVSYRDNSFANAYPRSKLCVALGFDFWDGCTEANLPEDQFLLYYAIATELGAEYSPIKNFESGGYSTVTVTTPDATSPTGFVDRYSYVFRKDTYKTIGLIFKNLTPEEYLSLMEYQDREGIQVIYPALDTTETKRITSGPNMNIAGQDQQNANYWFQTRMDGSKTAVVLNEDGDGIAFNNVYQDYSGENAQGLPMDGYISRMMVDGTVAEDGTRLYDYAERNQTGYKVRVNYLAYYKYVHTVIEDDGITEPSYLFGSDTDGRDILSNLASGARFSFLLAIIVASINLFVGAMYGAVEGYYGGLADLMMERFSDIIAAIPFMIVITLLKLNLGPKGGSDLVILFISFFATGWVSMAGRTRMQFYRFKGQEYVLAARTLGASDGRLMFKHIFPNSLGTLITACVLVIPGVIYSESSLSYLGIINLATGNITSVGTLLSRAGTTFSQFPYMMVPPALFISLLMLSFNLFGNGLRDAFNPSLRGAED